MKKEGEMMTRIINEINNVKIPPYIREEIGISDNWVDKVSPKKKKLAVKTANRFKEVLRKLSRN